MYVFGTNVSIGSIYYGMGDQLVERGYHQSYSGTVICTVVHDEIPLYRTNTCDFKCK